MSTMVMDLAAQIEILTTKVGHLTDELPARNQAIHPPHGSPWSNPSEVQRMKSSLKSSLMIKPNNLNEKPDIKTIKKVVEENNLQVHHIGVSKTGNTFINCPSEKAREELNQKLQQTAELSGYTPEPLQDHHPTISIIGVTNEELDPSQTGDAGKTELINKFRAQNTFLRELMDKNHSFKILFIKPPNGNYKNYQIVARVSPVIRDAISAKWNRLFICATSVKVNDRFYIKRCWKCNKFGHYSGDCKGETSCGICASLQHKTDDCNHKDLTNTTNLNCINCLRERKPSNGHTATSPKCPAYVSAQKKLRGNIPYYQALKNRLGHSLY